MNVTLCLGGFLVLYRYMNGRLLGLIAWLRIEFVHSGEYSGS